MVNELLHFYKREGVPYMANFLYCPICGKIISSFNKFCPNCKGTTPPHKSLYDSSYYKDKAERTYGVSSMAFKILILEEASKSNIFDKTKCAIDIDLDNRISEYRTNPPKYPVNNTTNKPKCPTCGSTNIKKISATSKVLGAAMWGLFSKTAHSQFQCNNCGYKW